MAGKLTKMNRKESFSLDTVEKVMDTIRPEMIAEALRDCMQATTTNKEGTFPDYRVRLQATQLAIETTMGRAVQRQEIIHKEIKSEEDTWEAIAKSPAALAALEKKIQQARAKMQLVEEVGPLPAVLPSPPTSQTCAAVLPSPPTSAAPFSSDTPSCETSPLKHNIYPQPIPSKK